MADKEKKKVGYAEAVAEIEDILRRMDSQELDVDRLGEYVERATELISVCKEKLLKAQKQVEAVLEKEEQSS